MLDFSSIKYKIVISVSASIQCYINSKGFNTISTPRNSFELKLKLKKKCKLVSDLTTTMTYRLYWIQK